MWAGRSSRQKSWNKEEEDLPVQGKLGLEDGQEGTW